MTEIAMRYKVNEKGCWIFLGPTSHFGYGKISFKGETYNAHRLMAHIAIQPITHRTQIVAHKCDTPACINPEHLFVTTYLGNSQDRDLKKRGACGEKSHLSKLTDADVKEIIKLGQSGMKISLIAKKYPQVKYGTVRAIVRRKIWKHIS